jgi:magnesium transporter
VSALSTFYLSRLIGRKVIFDDGSPGGVLKDLIVDVNTIRPMVIGAVVKIGSELKTLGHAKFTFSNNGTDYAVRISSLREFQPSGENSMWLTKHILGKRIIDIDGRKLVKVNDIRLATLSSGVYIVAVDIGLEGLLRRAGLAKPIKRALKFFGLNLPGRLILWDDVETIDSSKAGIKLSKDYSKLSNLHPSDIADLLEGMDKSTQLAVFSSLDEDRAANVLEELEPDAQVQVIENLPVDKAVDVLEKMPSEDVADILDEVNEEKAEELLGEMEVETSEEVRELMHYPENTAGSLMSPDYIAFNENTTVEATLQMLRKLKPKSQNAYYLYIINDMERLVATVSLRDIVVSEPQTKLKDIMDTNIIYVNAFDKLNALTDIVSKYGLLAVPVVDDNMVLVGVVAIDDVIYNILKSKRRI